MGKSKQEKASEDVQVEESQLSLSEARAAVEEAAPQKTAEVLRALARNVVKAVEDAEKAEPSVDTISRSVETCLASAKTLAEQGRYQTTVTLPELNYQGGYRVLSVLKIEHGFDGRQSAYQNKVQVELSWGP